MRTRRAWCGCQGKPVGLGGSGYKNRRGCQGGQQGLRLSKRDLLLVKLRRSSDSIPRATGIYGWILNSRVTSKMCFGIMALVTSGRKVLVVMTLAYKKQHLGTHCSWAGEDSHCNIGKS